KLNPPTNLTVKNGTDSNLCVYWNHTAPINCVDSEVRYRTNNNKWATSQLGSGKQNYCINLPSSSSLYELQVRNSIADSCGRSGWSDWSQPVFWGSMRQNNSTAILLVSTLLCLTDVECMVMNLEYVHCMWNGHGTPDVNYTFHSRFSHEEFSECATYISENSTVIGCNRPYKSLSRFETFYINLQHGNDTFLHQHDLKSKVKLNPPTNLTVKDGTDSNLCVYWNHTAPIDCVDSEVRYRTNNKWETSKFSSGKRNFCINLPSSSSLYELQVRNIITDCCGRSGWSDWIQPVFWDSMRQNNGMDNSLNAMSVWTRVLCVVGAFTLILLVMMLVYCKRLRSILNPIVPNPGNLDENLIHDNVERMKRTCPVHEYSCVPPSDSESSDSSSFSTTTDQTDFSSSMPANQSEGLSTSCFSCSTSTWSI
uniref:cytokine receptor common subunit gamma-like n=1 Tax=Centroberyx gerrardi TaxID=166262 RepID=UPI003AAF352C